MTPAVNPFSFNNYGMVSSMPISILTADSIGRTENIMRLENKIAFITGGNSGIGLATARLFVREGATVILTGRNQKTLNAVAEELVFRFSWKWRVSVPRKRV
jgi:NADPH:quinone reductase-like Zn-dependent oxidoreductase